LYHKYYLFIYFKIYFTDKSISFILKGLKVILVLTLELNWLRNRNIKKQEDDVEGVELVPELPVCSSREDPSSQFCNPMGCWRPHCSVHHSFSYKKATPTFCNNPFPFYFSSYQWNFL